MKFEAGKTNIFHRRAGVMALGFGLLAGTSLLPAACSATSAGSTFESSGGGQSSNPTGGGGGGSVSSSSSGEGGGLEFDAGGNNTGGGGGGINCVPKGLDDDVDGDGYTPNEGDCNDCDKSRNPNAVEVIGEPGTPAFDENCDGVVDEVAAACDNNLEIDSLDALDGARAIELCKLSTGIGDWGVVAAAWVMADGSLPPAGNEVNFHLGHGLLTAFGPNNATRKGSRLLALSSGTARQPTDPGYQSVNGFGKGYQGAHPIGFPKESPACPGSITGAPNDPTALEVRIRVPSNAFGFSFDFNFFTYEWPNYICSQYNDFFVALLSPIPPGQPDGNVSFDSQGNPVSVNNAFLEVCGCPENPPSPCLAGGKFFPCSLGNIGLIGTGFGFDTEGSDHAATDWLKTQAPVTPGSEITMRWAVYDSGDGALDSTGLVDNWQWIAKPGTQVVTDPVPK